MNPALHDMVAAYKPVTQGDYQNAAREVVQEIALLGLWRSGFFEHAAFYGGTALRIFHGLARFSEDLDFTRLTENSEVRLESHLPGIATELASWGFAFDAESKSVGERSGIESAFLKGNTQMNLLQIGAPADLATRMPRNQKIQIKLELDLNPPPFAATEVRTQLLPTPYQVRLYDPGSLLAGKLHAVLCRTWKSRVKGRDFYDLVWYVARKIPPNIAHLEARMRQSGHWGNESLVPQRLRDLLKERFQSVDFQKAADDVRVFLRDPRELDLWSRKFFEDLADHIVPG
jgi:predicted nucleotidyltransferase component of viral defense system